MGAFLFGSAALGPVVYGTYGLVRGVSTWAFLLAPVSVDSEAFIAHWTRRLTLAKSATGLSLLFVSGFSVGAVGLS